MRGRVLSFLLWLSLAVPAWGQDCAYLFEQIQHPYGIGKVYRFQKELADRSGIPIHEVEALVHNFFGDLQPNSRWLRDGALGIFPTRKGYVIDPKYNLLNAYKKMSEEIVPGEVTVAQLMELGKLSFELQTLPGGRSLKWRTFGLRNLVTTVGGEPSPAVRTFLTELGYELSTERVAGGKNTVIRHAKSIVETNGSVPEEIAAELSIAGIAVLLPASAGGNPRLVIERNREFRDTVHPEAKALMESYGIQVEQNGGRVKLSLTPGVDLEQQLGRFADRINESVRRGSPPEYVAAQAVQELLLLHPFPDNNGRSARLLGHILFRKLTGRNIKFPSKFHEEMNHSVRELAETLFSPFQSSYPLDEEVMQSPGHAYELFYRSFGVLPQAIDVGVPPVNAPKDTPFGAFKVGGQPVDYVQPRTRDFKRLLFWGIGEKDLEAARNRVRKTFQFGRRANQGHRDVRQHVLTNGDDGPSGFLPTTQRWAVADDFSDNAGKSNIIFLIDPEQAPILEVDKVLTTKLKESEFIFDTTLAPTRVYGALIRDTATKTVELWTNPNYRPAP